MENKEKSQHQEQTDTSTSFNVWETLGEEVPFLGKQGTDMEKSELADNNSELNDEANLELTNERAQEIFERELTEGITDIEELRSLAEAKSGQVIRDNLEFEGKTVEVLRVNGLPMRFLKHWINSFEVRNNPSIWAKKASEFKSFNKGVTGSAFNPNQEGTASNIISSTYVDTNFNPDMLRGNAYIFTKIRPQSILAASSGDAWTTGDMGNSTPKFVGQGREFSTPSEIAKESSGTQLNEVVIKRYDEFGNPLLPTAILNFSLQGYSSISDDSLRSAAYFEVPIIEANLDSYPGAIMHRTPDLQEEPLEDVIEDDWGGEESYSDW